MELDAVEESVLVDWPGMRGPCSERFEVRFAGPLDIDAVDRTERDQLDRINLDVAFAHAVATSRLHLRPLPESERDRDVTRHYVCPQLPTELHGVTLRLNEKPAPTR